MDSELDVQRITDGLQTTLRRLGSLAGSIAMVAGLVGVATFLTGLMVFDGAGRPLWLIIGGAICAVPLGAALTARFLVRSTAKHSSELIANVRQFVKSSTNSAQVLIDHESGRPVAVSAKSFGDMRRELNHHRTELPALFAGVRAITSVPGLAALSVVGIVGVGLLGTVLLIGVLID